MTATEVIACQPPTEGQGGSRKIAAHRKAVKVSSLEIRKISRRVEHAAGFLFSSR
jgi:hypothetical protein